MDRYWLLNSLVSGVHDNLKVYTEMYVSKASSFTDGVHCPIGFYYYYGELEFVKFADLESSSHCLHKLQLDASILNYASGCPSDFWWKGRSSPPSGGFSLTYSDVSIHVLVLTCVLIVFGVVYAIVLLVASIVWRNNK